MTKHFSFLRLALIGLTLTVTGCTHNMVRNMAADGMVSFGNDYIKPWFMASTDTHIMCAVGEGMAPMTFPLGPNIDPMIPMVTLASGMCASNKAKDEELRYIRAMRKNDVADAMDARTMQKRWMQLAAERQYMGYQAVVRYFGEPGDKCPKFDDHNERMSYLFGLFGGFQAFQTDLANGGTAGVPLGIMPKALKGLTCLDNKEFWGLPEAIPAMVEIMKAKIGSDQAAIDEGTAKLKEAEKIGNQEGVRMVQLLEATLYASQGDDEKTKDVIRNFVKTGQERPANPKLRLLDEMAARGIQEISDKLWTENTGHRTPYNQLGTFWDDKMKTDSSVNFKDLL